MDGQIISAFHDAEKQDTVMNTLQVFGWFWREEHKKI